MKRLFTLCLMCLPAFLFAQSNLVISEIMYNPPESGTDSLEYIEIYNPGIAGVSLQGYSFTGVTYTFGNVMIGGGGYLVVCVDSLAMQNVFGVPAYQWTSGGLSNSGETIVLKDGSNNTVDSVNYDDSGVWPTEPDGNGYSLELCNLTSDNADGANWGISSTNTGIVINTFTVFGSPGYSNGCLRTITFQVDMSMVGTIASTVSVAGDFQTPAGYGPNWTPGSTVLTDPDNDSIYTLTVQVPDGTYEFKYVNGTMWGQDETVPSSCAQNNNRYVVVNGDMTLTAVCFGSCFPCSFVVPQKMVTFQVDMSQQAVSANGVHVAGSFQGWDPAATMMAAVGNGIFSYQTMLDSGNTYEYKYLNGNAWGTDESVPAPCAQNNNRFFTLTNDTILPAVLFGTCAPAPGIPVYPIGTVNTVDANGVADSNGVNCEVRGTVISTNFRTGGLEFFINDGTGGIDVFSSSNAFGYTVNIGDSIHVQGSISQYNGLTEILADTVVMAVPNNRTPVPTVVDSLGEYTEAELLRIHNATLVNPSQWPNPGSDANVSIQVGSLVFTMRIDKETNIDNLVTAPTGAFDLIGVGSQFDGSNPYTSGYQIFPRMDSDIIPSNYGAPCGDLFFSEYIEGSSNNKVLEIYNPSNQAIDLSNYTIERYNNGSSTNPDVFGMAGNLNPGDVYVIANDQADSALFRSKADTTGSATFYNGDDALLLVTNGVILDAIGIVGMDPGTNWPVGTGATSEYTLVRKSTVLNGTTDWTVGATQWDVFPQNFADSLGMHHTIPCGSVNPILAYGSVSQNVQESVGTTSVTVAITNPNSDTTRVEAYIKGGTAVNGTDYQFTNTIVTFLPNSGTPQNLTITILDNAVQEPDRTIILGLRNPTNNATISLDETTITILDDDTPIPYYTIATVHTEDTMGVADSIGVLCELHGVVTSIDYFGTTGLQFYMSDGTGGINVFNFNDVSGYVVTVGDSIHVIGTVDQFRGLTEFMPDSIALIASGLPVNATMTNQLDENNESELVSVYGLTIIDTMEWTNSGSGFNVRFAKVGTTDTFVVRVDNDAEPFGEPHPELGKYYIITGVVTQYSSSSSAPFLDGYQILTRFNSDIVEILAPTAGFDYLESPLLTVAFTDTSSNMPTMWAWTFGDGGTSNVQHPTHTYAAKGMYEVCLTASNPAGNSTTCDSVAVGPIGIEGGAELPTITVYPVPAHNTLVINSDVAMGMIRVLDVQGREVITASASGQQELHIDMSRLANGVYVIEIETAKRNVRKQVTKQ